MELLEEDRATLELKLAEAMVDLENAQRVAKVSVYIHVRMCLHVQPLVCIYMHVWSNNQTV